MTTKTRPIQAGKTPDLFPDLPRTQSSRSTDHEKLKVWKALHGVWSDKNGDEDAKWLVCAVPACHKILKGYDLTKDELEDPIMMFAGYCRLIEEADLCAWGPTEYKACEELAKLNSIKFP